MTKEPLGVCDRGYHKSLHEHAVGFCLNWRPVEASAPTVWTGAAAGSPPGFAEASAPAAPPDTRTIQDVLRLHVKSSQDMYETYKRVGDVDGCKFQDVLTQGLERAIEVANNRDARQAAPKDQTQAIEEAVRVVDRMTCQGCAEDRQRYESGMFVGCVIHQMDDPIRPSRLCTAQGRAIVTAILPMLRGGK